MSLRMLEGNLILSLEPNLMEGLKGIQAIMEIVQVHGFCWLLEFYVILVIGLYLFSSTTNYSSSIASI